MESDIDKDHVTDPEENPTKGGHLPVSGEMGGQIVDDDPLTIDTNDDPDNDPTLLWEANQADSAQIPTPDAATDAAPEAA